MRRLACFLAFCLVAPNLMAAERPFPTLVVLGAAEPLNSDEAIATPILVVDHETSSPEGAQFNFLLRTSRLNSRWKQPLTEGWFYTPEVDLHFMAAGDPGQAYSQGHLVQGASLASNRLSAQLGIATQGDWGEAGISAVMAKWVFSATPATGKFFDLPHNMTEQGLRASWQWQPLWRGWQQGFAVEASEVARQEAASWQWEATPRTHIRSHTARAETGREGEASLIKFKFAQAGGQNLDFLSSHQTGGAAGDFPLIGFYRNEFRSTALTWGEASLKAKWGKSNGGLFVQAAHFRLYASPLYQQMEPEYQLASAGVSLYHPLEALWGMPLILQAGSPLGLPADFDRANPRLELLVALAAGF